MTKEEAIKYIKYCMCEGRLVGNTRPIIDEKWQAGVMAIEALKAQPEDYTELKQEFLRMASYIDVLLECSDEQKETLLGFISRLAEFMPWTEKD